MGDTLTNEMILYTTPDGAVRVEVYREGETFWLSQRQMADLFGVEVPTINHHLKNIYRSGELTEQATIRQFRIVRSEGKRSVSREIAHYDLDAIISVGYRVNSIQATRFRVWATQTLRGFIIKGFVLDSERLKLNARLGRDYFDELLDKIREIRASERRFYLKITDIYQTCSVDYDKASAITRTFFKTVQNKLHWAITGHTAPEIVAARADPDKPAMGLTSWKNAPDGKVTKADVTVAKNYLTQPEIKALERIVSMYLDYAESQAERGVAMRMRDWIDKLDAFLAFNDYAVLSDLGRVERAVADAVAHEAYAAFRVRQDQAYQSDFERAIEEVDRGGSE